MKKYSYLPQHFFRGTTKSSVHLETFCSSPSKLALFGLRKRSRNNYEHLYGHFVSENNTSHIFPLYVYICLK